MTTAFVLSGGASLGATQVGMLQALSRAGIRPDLLVGTSVGALNGAWAAETWLAAPGPPRTTHLAALLEPHSHPLSPPGWEQSGPLTGFPC